MSDLLHDRADCSHLWKDGWCSFCGVGWATWSAAEIAHLHAEAESLRKLWQVEHTMVLHLREEREEALAQVAGLEKALVLALQYAGPRVAEGEVSTNKAWDEWEQVYQQIIVLRGKRLPGARALLDRLHNAERAAAQPFCGHESILLEQTNQAQEFQERLQRAEAVIALAAEAAPEIRHMTNFDDASDEWTKRGLKLKFGGGQQKGNCAIQENVIMGDRWSAEEWARVAVSDCPQKLPRGTITACEDCIAEVLRAYARECVGAWREKVIELAAAWERAYPGEIFGPVSEGEPDASSNRIAAQQSRHMAHIFQKDLRALPVEAP